MKRLWRRLDVRLFASYALVALVVIGALWITVSLVAPAQFDNEFRATATAHEDAEEREAEGHSVFVSALRSSLPYALAASFAAAAIVSVLVARKILRPVRQVRSATRRLAAGHYDEPVEEPAELELAELARDVNLLAVQLQTTERRRARLIGEVAHEMRTPLTTIEGLVEGMLDEVFEPNEEVLTSLAEEATRLQRLASDLSELSRAEEGAIVLDLERVDLGELAGGVCQPAPTPVRGQARRARGPGGAVAPGRRRRGPDPAGADQPVRQRAHLHPGGRSCRRHREP